MEQLYQIDHNEREVITEFNIYVLTFIKHLRYFDLAEILGYFF